jgi:hypothetical protein
VELILKILFSLEGGWLTKSEGASLEYYNQVIIMHDSFQECWFSKLTFLYPQLNGEILFFELLGVEI